MKLERNYTTEKHRILIAGKEVFIKHKYDKIEIIDCAVFVDDSSSDHYKLRNNMSKLKRIALKTRMLFKPSEDVRKRIGTLLWTKSMHQYISIKEATIDRLETDCKISKDRYTFINHNTYYVKKLHVIGNDFYVPKNIDSIVITTNRFIYGSTKGLDIDFSNCLGLVSKKEMPALKDKFFAALSTCIHFYN